MNLDLNNLSERNKHMDRLSGAICVTSGADTPKYIDELTRRSGDLGFVDWSQHWNKPSGVEQGGGTLDKYYSIVVVPVNRKQTFGTSFKIGNPTQRAVPVQAEQAALDIDWTLPVNTQKQNVRVGIVDTAGTTTVLTDSTKSFATNEFQGFTLYNASLDEEQAISSNTGTTITTSAFASGWSVGDDYQVRTNEATHLYIYVCESDTAIGATTAPLYFLESVTNGTTSYTQTVYSANLGLIDTNRFAPPNGSFCMTAFDRLYVAGGLEESRGQAQVINTNSDSEQYLVATGNIDVSVVTSTSGGTSGQIVRYTRNTGTWDTDVLFIGAYVTVATSTGTLATANELADVRVLYVDPNGAYFDALNEAATAEAGVTCDINFQLNYIQGNTSGVDQTYFNGGFAGSKFFLDGDSQAYTIAWVDAFNQRMGLTTRYVGSILETDTGFILNNDTKVSYSITNDPNVHPATNYVEVDDYVTALAHIGSIIIVFCERSIYRFSADAPEQGLSTIQSGKGCPAPFSVLMTSRGIIFWDGEGISVTNGQDTSSLSENKIDDLLELVNRDFEWNIRAVYDSDEEMVEYFFPIGGEVTNDTSVAIRLSSGDIYPNRRKDVNAVWREKGADGRWYTMHGSSDRHTDSGDAYVWQHSDGLPDDGVPGTVNVDDFTGHVTSIADAGTNKLRVRAATLGFEIGDADTEPYLLEGLPISIRSGDGLTESYAVIKKAEVAALATEGNALYIGSTGAVDSGVTTAGGSNQAMQDTGGEFLTLGPLSDGTYALYNATLGETREITAFTDTGITTDLFSSVWVTGDAYEVRRLDIGKTLYIGLQNLNSTGLAAHSNTYFDIERRHNGMRIYNVTTGAEGVIKEQTLDTVTCMCGEGYVTGAASLTVMTDSAMSKYGIATNSLVDKYIVNVTDGSRGLITANTGTSITVGAMVGGSSDQFSTGDEWIVYGLWSSDTVHASFLSSSVSTTFVQDTTTPQTWTVDEWIGYYAKSLDDGSLVEIISNSATRLRFASGGSYSVGESMQIVTPGGSTLWEDGSASAVGDAYQIGKQYDVTISGDYSITNVGVHDSVFVGTIPATFGPKWTDFGSPHLKKHIKRVHIDVEGDDGNWLIVEMYKDGATSPVQVQQGYVNKADTKFVADFNQGKCYNFGLRIVCFGRNNLNIHSIGIEHEPLT